LYNKRDLQYAKGKFKFFEDVIYEVNQLLMNELILTYNRLIENILIMSTNIDQIAELHEHVNYKNNVIEKLIDQFNMTKE